MTRKFKKFISHFLGVTDLIGCYEYTLYVNEESHKAIYIMLAEQLRLADTDKIYIDVNREVIEIKYKRINLIIVKE